MRSSRTAAVVLAATLVATSAVLAHVLRPAPSRSPEALLGERLVDELVDALELEPVKELPLRGCRFAAEAGKRLFCLEGRVSGAEEFFDLARRLRGFVPGDIGRIGLELRAELREIENRLRSELDRLLQELIAKLREILARHGTPAFEGGQRS